ncbi:glutamine-synthetase adenylyltransferase [Roseobacter sp. OBYS 0001]|uniref:[protein-PII] uridylyltransferase family protein n=1 Tax=Roseobacter sp. OBYS 0001 TaxID=882651 RepID=UPI001BBFD6CB|nr:glutamine-synthetase adenylyltransferase [Roseobacter sp. OBYS 0001]GIT85610.1 glutamate-ammonia-ligase adenylyltransferase [Roseobacter sp. OBYS 0001]
MNLSNAIRRVPTPFDTQKGQDVAALLPEFGPEISALIAGAAGCSPYLAGLIEKEQEWLRTAFEDIDKAVADELATTASHAPDALANGLRRSKRRVAVMSALADLGGAWPLARVTGALTDLADAACQAALKAAVRHQIQRGKLPGMDEGDAEDAAGMAVLAMGKMGAHELNYSSDIDLICLFDETRFDADTFQQARSAFSRATRAMAATLSEITAQGYVFRTDLRLRPDPSVTPVCIAMEAAEQYYESLGRTWERAAYIKARVAAGDESAGNRFLKTLTPFVWRRHLDFAAIQDAHDMRLAIREHKGLGGPITLPGHDMKLGRGGIREIEFFTQTRQLIAGGRDPELRCRGTLKGLELLAEKKWVESDVAEALSDHYVAHRTVEHRLQMVQDAQTHTLPKTDENFARLAAMMATDVETLQADLRRRLAAVHEMTEGFFAPSKPDAPAPQANLDVSILNRWVSYPALRSTRSRQIFDRVKPDLLARLSGTARPQDALIAFDGFLAGLPAGVQLFSLLDANPQLTDLIIDISGTSPALAQYLSRNAGVFDAVIGGDFFSDWPKQAGLEQALQEEMARETDYELRLDTTRRWHKEWNFRIGVHLLRGLISAQEASVQYADLARAVLAVLWPIVIDNFALKHGAAPGRGAVVLGMGSLGGGTLNAGSDLDLIVIYDPLDVEASGGKKSLASRVYYARLTQALITALSAPMAQGKLFEVDMRLRPSGNQGPVATSWPAFQSYQRDQAWTWEHLALTRANVIAGPQALARDVAAFKGNVLSMPRKTGDVLKEVADMRQRLQQAKSPPGLFEAKIGPGRLQEIELLAQAGALLTGKPMDGTADGIAYLANLGVLSAEQAADLTAAAALFLNLHTAVRLLSDQPLDAATLAPAAQGFLTDVLHCPSFDAFETKLAERYQRCDQILTTVLSVYATNGDLA